MRVAGTYRDADGDDLVERKTLKIQKEEEIIEDEGMGASCNKNEERRRTWLQTQVEYLQLVRVRGRRITSIRGI